MKVFFVGSPRTLQTHKKELHKIYNTIDQLGHENLYHLMVESDPATFYHKSQDQIDFHFKRTLKALHSADIIIIECSIHSLSMGYLARMGEELNKPVIIMHLNGCEPFFFSGNKYDRFYVCEYNLNNIQAVLTEAIEYAKDSMDIRFNLFLPPKINSYLKWITKRENMNRSVFVRHLLQEHMKQHPDFENTD